MGKSKVQWQLGANGKSAIKVTAMGVIKVVARYEKLSPAATILWIEFSYNSCSIRSVLSSFTQTSLDDVQELVMLHFE